VPPSIVCLFIVHTSSINSLLSGGSFAQEHVPEEIRHILTAEAAANDGLAYPFLSISIYLMTESSVRAAIQKGFLIGWLCKILFMLYLPIS